LRPYFQTLEAQNGKEGLFIALKKIPDLTALTGLSTTAYIRDQRLRMAIQRLEKSDDTISEIAYAVGFSSPSYFIKTFKETYSMTPSEYQESKAKK